MDGQIRFSFLFLNALLALSRIPLSLPGVHPEFKKSEPGLGLLWKNEVILQQNLEWTIRLYRSYDDCLEIIIH